MGKHSPGTMNVVAFGPEGGGRLACAVYDEMVVIGTKA